MAKWINEDSYGLIFGINTFTAILVQTIITIAVTSEGGLALNERDQFKVYAAYNILLGLVFVTAAIYTLVSKRGFQKRALPRNSQVSEYGSVQPPLTN